MLVSLSVQLPENTVLDRVLPFLTEYLSDECASVRAGAILGVGRLLKSCRGVDVSNHDFFCAYLAPKLLPLATDMSESVRCALAVMLPSISTVAMTFMEMIQVIAIDQWCGFISFRILR